MDVEIGKPGNVFEGMVLFLEIDKDGDRETGNRARAWKSNRRSRQPISIPVREGIQQNTLDDAGDHGRRSNAQGKGQDGNDSKAAILSQHPQPVAKVEPKARHLCML